MVARKKALPVIAIKYNGSSILNVCMLYECMRLDIYNIYIMYDRIEREDWME